MIEFALLLPVFVLLMFGVLEFGRLMQVVQAVHAGARAGVREAALSGSTAATTKAAALGALALIGVSTGGIDPVLTPSDPAGAAVNSSVSVKLVVPFSSVSWLGLYLQSAKIQATYTLRKED